VYDPTARAGIVTVIDVPKGSQFVTCATVAPKVTVLVPAGGPNPVPVIVIGVPGGPDVGAITIDDVPDGPDDPEGAWFTVS
jgi:hypothetical protein